MSELSEGEAFYESFLAPLEGRMLRAVWRVVRDPELARDGLQDAMTTLWRRRDRVRAHPNPEALILRICITSAVDLLRKNQRYRRVAQEALTAEVASASHLEPGRTVERAELREQVLEAIGRLPPKRAVAVMMRIVEDQPYSAIAEALGCSEATARVHVMRGRAGLSERLGHLVSPAPAGGAGK
jgi:RNA polymerase sigma-70 factor (ECF subfamily)